MYIWLIIPSNLFSSKGVNVSVNVSIHVLNWRAVKK